MLVSYNDMGRLTAQDLTMDKDKRRIRRNLTAKHDMNKGGIHRDRKNDYKRQVKHKSKLLEVMV